jgi:hypothetical protein
VTALSASRSGSVAVSAARQNLVAVPATRQSAQWAIQAETGAPFLAEDGNAVQPENAKPSGIQLTASKS